jgi:hypothetical protein
LIAGLLPLVIDDHAVEGGLDLPRTIPTKKDLQVFQRIAGFGDADAFADDFLKVHQLSSAQ